MKNIDIREYIKNNFKGTSAEELEDSILASIESKDEVVLPGLGVLFEILWNKSSAEFQNTIINTLHNNM